MSLQVLNIKRSFKMVNDDKTTPLPDVNPNMSPDEILNFYSATYPLLTSATVDGPEVVGDEAVYTFTTQLGTKG